MTTFTVAPSNTIEIADTINTAAAQGQAVWVDGREVYTRYRHVNPARACQNGTVEVQVRARKGNTSTSVYSKVGQQIEVQVIGRPRVA